MSGHGTKTRYSEDKCRCPLCRAAWNLYYRARARAVQRLINAHRGEFDRYFTEEQGERTEPVRHGVVPVVGSVDEEEG